MLLYLSVRKTLEAKNQQGCGVILSHFSWHPWFLSSFLLRVLGETDLKICHVCRPFPCLLQIYCH